MDRVLLEGMDGFADLQIVQSSIDEIVVTIVPGKSFRQQDAARFCWLLAEKLRDEAKVRCELVREIPRTEPQKEYLVVSRLESR